MQFFQLIQKGNLWEQDVINIWWYRRNAVGLPSDGDLVSLRDAWRTEVWTPIRAQYSNNYVLSQITVQGFQETWARSPYLPLVTDYVENGTNAGVAGPPIQCAILTHRVEPVAVDPVTSRPVRRGYMALSGLPDAHFQPNGRITQAFLSGGAVVFQTAGANAFQAGTVTEDMEPIRVSRLALGQVARGYGLVKACAVSPLVSARRSRKVGQGAR